ncbi:NAD-P-binding protein [Laetiporus sulphureus 93-53]|uniref:NAD-P-binding protein n=1 Tax=Laetiporus sulphureus 93-53 TaxID=1314785 RepID=A0A165BHB3_9APHY|nr:NAD-P-binding protein [Laetiporus sulphureus 93-53]KZT01056.1 NAD-P-binding protein [Laetiporus sulphureus 93-53]
MDPTPNLPASALFSLAGQNVLITGASRGTCASIPLLHSTSQYPSAQPLTDNTSVLSSPTYVLSPLGIGAACAIALAEAGADLCLVERPSTAAKNTATRDAIAVLGRTVRVVECDLADLEDVKTVFARALDAMGGEIHVLVNCAGIQRRSPAVQFPEADWDDVINVNLKSVWLLSQAAGQHMVPRRRGKIINFCSLLTFQGGLTVPAYAAAKGALGQLTKALSNEWSKDNVQVNGICPGYIATDMNERLLQDPTRLRQITERIPAGRWGEPKDFAGPVVFLASKASQYVCGELLVVDGGWMGR